MNDHHSQDEKIGFLKGSMLGVAVGAVVGAVAGILFAPQSGKETRAQLASLVKKTAAELEHKIVQVKDKVVDFSDAIGRDIAKLLDRAHELKDELADYAKKVSSGEIKVDDVARKQAQKLIDESQKVLADLDRMLEKKANQASVKKTDAKK